MDAFGSAPVNVAWAPLLFWSVVWFRFVLLNGWLPQYCFPMRSLVAQVCFVIADFNLFYRNHRSVVLLWWSHLIPLLWMLHRPHCFSEASFGSASYCTIVDFPNIIFQSEVWLPRFVFQLLKLICFTGITGALYCCDGGIWFRSCDCCIGPIAFLKRCWVPLRVAQWLIAPVLFSNAKFDCQGWFCNWWR